MKKVVKQIVLLAAISVLASCVTLPVIGYVYQGPFFRESWVRERPYGLYDMNKMGTFSMDPKTILSSLERGDSDVFVAGKTGTDMDEVGGYHYGPILYTDTISWTQADHWTVAIALNEFVWKDTLNQWNLFYMKFSAPCEQDIDGLKGSEFRFFRAKWNMGKLSYLWRGISLTPEYRDGIWAEDENHNPPLTGWKKIDLERLTITAENALKLAEESGGREYRSEVQNQCIIFVSMMPNNWNGWWIHYWAGASWFDVYVDPMTGAVLSSKIYRD